MHNTHIYVYSTPGDPSSWAAVVLDETPWVYFGYWSSSPDEVDVVAMVNGLRQVKPGSTVTIHTYNKTAAIDAMKQILPSSIDLNRELHAVVDSIWWQRFMEASSSHTRVNFIVVPTQGTNRYLDTARKLTARLVGTPELGGIPFNRVSEAFNL